MHHSQLLLLASYLAANIAALPLNINLGAYSPALVVGDGEISFGGNQDVSNLMNALEGAAVSGEFSNLALSTFNRLKSTTNQCLGAAANGAPNAAPAAAPAPAPAANPAPAAANIVPTDQGNTQITALQGMGKEITPRIIPMVKSEKRDINGFNAALKYATDAIKTSPKVQLGTEAAGIGILQDAGISAPATPAAAGAAKAARDMLGSGEKKLRTTVTTMFVRGGPAPAQAGTFLHPTLIVGAVLMLWTETSNEDGSVAPVENRTPALSEGVNLNMAEGQVAELRFVETRAVDDEEE